MLVRGRGVAVLGLALLQGFLGCAHPSTAVAHVRPQSAPHAVSARALVPEGATLALMLPELGARLEELIDSLERVFGVVAFQRVLAEGTLASLLLELMQDAAESGLDQGRGAALFTHPKLDGWVLALGVRDGARAQGTLIRLLEQRAYRRLPQAAGPGTPERWVREDAPALEVTRAGELLYVLMQEPGVTAPTPLSRAAVLTPRPSTPALLARGRTTAADDGVLELFASLEAEHGTVEGVFLSLRLPSPDELRVEGVVFGQRPLWGAAAPPPPLVDSPRGPAAALAVSVDSGGVARLIDVLTLVAPLDGGREGEWGRLLGSLSGSAALVGYFDPESFLVNLARGSRKPELRGALRLELGLRDSERVLRMMEQLATELSLARSVGPDGTRFAGRFADHDVEVNVRSQRLSASAGTGLSGRPGEDVAARLERLLPGAFGPGHVSLLLDVGQVRRELEAPREVPGIDARELVTLQSLTTVFLDRLTAIDVVVLDLSPADEGARLLGRVLLRAGTSASGGSP